MAFRRLNDSDKQDILELYRQPGETTLTIADRYGVSNTTISRILKSSLSAEEYDRLIQQKRSHRFSSDTPGQGSLLEEEPVAPEAPAVGEVPIAEEAPIVEAIVQKEPMLEVSPGRVVPAPIKRKKQAVEESPAIPSELRSPLGAVELATQVPEAAQSTAVEALLGEDLAPSGADLLDEEEDDDLDDLDDLDEDFEDDDEDDDGVSGVSSLQLRSTDLVRVLPIAEAAIPRTCYLVIDRGAELVARPLSEFAELGTIPSGEIEEKTLPVFDNHRVARRFSNVRTQRVIKVPDSRILRKAASHLQAKGITRLLIDGQVYAL